MKVRSHVIAALLAPVLPQRPSVSRTGPDSPMLLAPKLAPIDPKSSPAHTRNPAAHERSSRPLAVDAPREAQVDAMLRCAESLLALKVTLDAQRGTAH